MLTANGADVEADDRRDATGRRWRMTQVATDAQGAWWPGIMADVAAAKAMAAKRRCTGGSKGRNAERGDCGESEEGTTGRHGSLHKARCGPSADLVETPAAPVHDLQKINPPLVHAAFICESRAHGCNCRRDSVISCDRRRGLAPAATFTGGHLG